MPKLNPITGSQLKDVLNGNCRMAILAKTSLHGDGFTAGFVISSTTLSASDFADA
jgi:hypothetical protein